MRRDDGDHASTISGSYGDESYVATATRGGLWFRLRAAAVGEHGFGVEIGTLDNPGWFLRIDLKHTALAALERDWSKLERSEHDWVHWRVAETRYEAYCGPTNLNEAILAFLDLAGARQNV